MQSVHDIWVSKLSAVNSSTSVKRRAEQEIAVVSYSVFEALNIGVRVCPQNFKGD